MFILSATNHIILAPLGFEGNTSIPVHFPELDEAIANQAIFATFDWDGEEYLVGIGASKGYRTYDGLGWKVLLRQKTSIAFVELKKLELKLGLVGGFLILLFGILGWIIAIRIVSPILKVVRSADGIMRSIKGHSAESPRRSISRDEKQTKDDIGILFLSIRNLMESIEQEEELRLMNENLEKSVRDRTIELMNANLKLRFESQTKEVIEGILANIMPPSICERLIRGEKKISDTIEDATIFFSDIVGFTTISSSISAEEVVAFLNDIFSVLDELAERHNVEKIKTIGDAYFAVGGLFENPNTGLTPRSSNMDKASVVAMNVLNFAIDAIEAVRHFNQRKKYEFSLDIRIGVNTGPVVAGIIGEKKLAFDLWGDAVNVASRMESSGKPGYIHVSESTYKRTKDHFHFEERGPIDVKGKGQMTTYFLLDKK
eukprot:TRINITY_DN5652_c0_g1_i1.p1 TRINITY_DN5652_c0_g1~~TRINITY_DN5652_c0_g1_i1.p1  ORF type:complete len:430 (+),score=124.80 TRINITY_DN5652_c0_g1_i1:588-1877(+)